MSKLKSNSIRKEFLIPSLINLVLPLMIVLNHGNWLPPEFWPISLLNLRIKTIHVNQRDNSFDISPFSF